VIVDLAAGRPYQANGALAPFKRLTAQHMTREFGPSPSWRIGIRSTGENQRMIRALSRLGKRRLALLGGVVASGLPVGWLLVKAANDAPAILAAGVTAAGAIMVGVIARRAAARAAAVAAHRAEVGPIYEGIVRRHSSLKSRPWRGEAPGARRTAAEPLSDREMEFADFMDEATQKLLIWGSPPVVEGWLAYHRALAQHIPGVTNDPYIGSDAWEQLLLVFRRDLGHDDRRLHKRDLSRMCGDVRDPEEVAPDRPESM